MYRTRTAPVPYSDPINPRRSSLDPAQNYPKEEKTRVGIKKTTQKLKKIRIKTKKP
jgi:hypothetical protein